MRIIQGRDNENLYIVSGFWVDGWLRHAKLSRTVHDTPTMQLTR